MKTCVICGENFEGYGNNPDPIKKTGECCDSCNRSDVIPARLAEVFPDTNIEDEPKAEDGIANSNATEFNIGDRVRYLHAGEETSDEVAEILDYDVDGLYVLLWTTDGTTSTGISDHNIVDEDWEADYDDTYDEHYG